MEASYCFIANEADKPNEMNVENAHETEANNQTDSSSSRSSENSEELNATTSINDLKKNLYNEEEFRSINHSEPIHIFLKLKPLSDSELAKQNHQVETLKT